MRTASSMLCLPGGRQSAKRVGWHVASVLLAAAALAGAPAAAQAPVPRATQAATPSQAAYPTPQAAFEAFVAALKGDEAAKEKVLGRDFRRSMPSITADEAAELRTKFLDAYAASNKVIMRGESEAMLEAGREGWTLPIPVVRGPDGWRFDLAAAAQEIKVRAIGRNEISAVQSLLALVDAQLEYAEMDPMKTGTAQYARRILSSPGKKDGLYWPQGAGDPESPLGELLATAQTDGANRQVGYHGYHFRLLYGQGGSAKGGAYSYIVKDRMVGGFAAVAWPVRYGETGVMTFIVNHDGMVFEKDLGPDTAAAAGRIQVFDPDKTWTKAEATP
jgi:hypothetical protein